MPPSLPETEILSLIDFSNHFILVSRTSIPFKSGIVVTLPGPVGIFLFSS